MYTYKLLPTYQNKSSKTILRLPDNAYIPFDQANTDHQAYLKWVEEGGIPEPADE